MIIHRLKTTDMDFSNKNLEEFRAKRIKEFYVTNHGCVYKISTAFDGLKIERMDSEYVSIFPENETSLVIK